MRRFSNSLALCALLVGGPILLLSPSLSRAGAEPLSTPGLSRFVLSNGMELFVFENHVVPLAKIQIVFRCGSITQTPQSAGLFHLYEHMLFKGNQVYRSEAAFQAAMKEIGVAGWNGGTSNEQVSYYFTVPSDKTGLGIAFWSNAVRYPLFDPKELEIEKKVVINEIRGYLNSPGDIFHAGMNRSLYFRYPWRRDVSGSEANISGATVEMMRAIQRRYYVPNNAALFVGGDVDPDHVRELAERYFGSWERAADPWAAPLPPHPAPMRDTFLTFADEQMYPGIARVTVRFRGPDVLSDPAATYAADVWGKFMDDPNGRFREDLMKKVPRLYNKEYISAFYYTQRDGGYVEFTTFLKLDPESSTYARVRNLLTAVRDELAAMTVEPGYFPSQEFQVLKTKLGDERLIERETAGRLISSLSFWWASADTDYYLGYLDNLKRVDRDDMSRFITTYLAGAHAVVGVLLNPRDQRRDDAKGHGFQILDRSNAFWWSDPKWRGSR